LASQEHVISANQGAKALMRKAAVRYFGSSPWPLHRSTKSPKPLFLIAVSLAEAYRLSNLPEAYQQVHPLHLLAVFTLRSAKEKR